MPKPKAKSGQAPKISLDEMLSKAATTNHLTGAGISAAPGTAEGSKNAPAPEPTPGNEEQKGENVSVAPAAETVAPAAPEPAAAPAPEAAAPAPEPNTSALEPAAEPTPAPAAAPVPEPAPTLAAGPAAKASVAPVASVPNGENVPEVEHSPNAGPEPGSAVEVGTVELASLFTPSVDKKVFTMRLTDAHYQYLLLLGTIVGNGASPPDIVHNIIAQFIDKNDAQIQKAITKQLRQRQGKK
ncbi:hypothetical protein ACFQT0_27905 [Hymenobacter humi]|uniref:DUF3408 domain-containing protein n=1 Tax=Hymenobacter humi TaxID=1411620 RepID=A0ABW2UEL6_9BACT